MTVTDRLLTENDEPTSAKPDFSGFPTDPPVDLPGVLDRLAALQIIADQHPPRFAEDGLACFNYLYHEITDEVWQQIQLGGDRKSVV